MAEKAVNQYSFEAYLALEADSDIKHEYHDGFIVAMAGGSPEHGQIQGNVITALNNALQAKDQPCIVFTSDVKVAIESGNRRFYPDASVVCGEIHRSQEEPQAIQNPILIVEVLSESTEAFDRGQKFYWYRQISSFQEYVLISQDQPMVEVFSRTGENSWQIQTAIGLDGNIQLASLSCQIQMADIYRLVERISS